jgi:hypothetical protein
MALEISYKVSNEKFTEKLKLDYNLEDVVIIETPYIDNVFLCIVSVDSETKLNELWSILNSVISSELSKRFENDFQMWNFYLFYLCSDEISTELKYAIINDKFSSRKVVVDKKGIKIDSQKIRSIISEYIVGNDIELGSAKKDSIESSSYYSDSTVFKNIESTYLKENEVSGDKDKLSETLLKIISEIRHEN